MLDKCLPYHTQHVGYHSQKAFKIIGVDESTAQDLSIPSLTHRRQVAADCVLYKMHPQQYPKDLNGMLPPPLERRRVTRASISTPDHAVPLPTANTHQFDRSFIHTASRIWNSLPDHVVGTPSCIGLYSFKRRAHRFLLTNGIS